MTCKRCIKPDAPRVTLVDGAECCTWCEDWRHECEARAILAIPALRKRRDHLYGKYDKTDRRVGGILQIRGEAAVKRLERTMMLLWNARQ